jgi:hypothetical protein
MMGILRGDQTPMNTNRWLLRRWIKSLHPINTELLLMSHSFPFGFHVLRKIFHKRVRQFATRLMCLNFFQILSTWQSLSRICLTKLVHKINSKIPHTLWLSLFNFVQWSVYENVDQGVPSFRKTAPAEVNAVDCFLDTIRKLKMCF